MADINVNISRKYFIDNIRSITVLVIWNKG